MLAKGRRLCRVGALRVVKKMKRVSIIVSRVDFMSD
jgi:hypothetical protein